MNADNVRKLLHALAATAGMVAAGSLVFAGEPTWLVGAAGVVAFFVNAYLGTSDGGSAKEP